MVLAASANVARRLPGFRFEAPPARIDQVLPRMDVAVFVGFSASGPLDRPVLVDSVAAFVATFGSDLELAWDPVRGESVRAYLAPAVRAFFRNGGRRCWVIRVAAQPQTNLFPLAGLVEVQGDGLAPALAPARSEGSWSDSVRISSGLLIQPIPVRQADLGALTLDAVATPHDLVVGDLLRIHLRATHQVLMGVVANFNRNTIALDTPVWFGRSPVATTGAATAELADGKRLSVVNPVTQFLDGDNATVELPLRLAAAPPAGSLVAVNLQSEQLWLTVLEVHGTGNTIRLSGQGLWWLPKPPRPTPQFGQNDVVERLTLQLRARTAEDSPLVLSNLGFDIRHPRFWGELPSDLDLFPALDAPLPVQQPPALWAEARQPRFPVAGASGSLYVPVVVPSASVDPLGPLPSTATRLERDGLNKLDVTTFLDSELIDATVSNLIGEADYIRYQSPNPRELRGIHAALAVEEATLICVPEIVHRGWRLDTGQSGPLPPPAESAQESSADGTFDNCSRRVIEPPQLSATDPDPAGTFSLDWTDVPGANYRLEEASRVGFEDAEIIYAGPEAQSTIYGHADGTFYYRVQASVGDSVSDWSDGIAVVVNPPARWVLLPAAEYSDALLLQVQRALLQLSAARGDLFAILSLPEHYREDQSIAHATLVSNDPMANSYGALYHPWLIGHDSGADVSTRLVPPDGAACGVAARRALARGAWISPANEAMIGVVALTPRLSEDRWLDLQTAQINLVRQDPRGFMSLSADTLATDPELRAINVRRLLELLRRLALQMGNNYVFEPNDAAFRRLVQRAFESMLANMLERGAFAGSSAATSFQVLTGDSVNPPTSVDAGRFIVELRVAPAQPLTFLTIRLIQLPNGSLIAQEAA